MSQLSTGIVEEYIAHDLLDFPWYFPDTLPRLPDLPLVIVPFRFGGNVTWLGAVRGTNQFTILANTPPTYIATHSNMKWRC